MTQQNSVLAFSVQDTSRLLILIYVQSGFSKTKFYHNRRLFCFQSSERRLYLENDKLPGSCQVVVEEACFVNIFRVD